jgi:hypothetical protein
MAMHMSVGLWNPRYRGRNRLVSGEAAAGPAALGGPGGACSSLGANGTRLAILPSGRPGLGSRACRWLSFRASRSAPVPAKGERVETWGGPSLGAAAAGSRSYSASGCLPGAASALSAACPGPGLRAVLRAAPGRPRRPLPVRAGGLRRLVSVMRRRGVRGCPALGVALRCLRLELGPAGGCRRVTLPPGGVLPVRAAAGRPTVSVRGGSSVSLGLVCGGASGSSRALGLAAGRLLAVRGGCSATSCCRGPVGLRGRLHLAVGPGQPRTPARGRGPVPLPPSGLPPSTARVPGPVAPRCPAGGVRGGGSPGLGWAGAGGIYPPWPAPSWSKAESNSSVKAAKSLAPKMQRSILAPVRISWVRCSIASVLQAWDSAARVMAGIWRANGPAKMPPEIGSILKLGLADRANSLRTLW